MTASGGVHNISGYGCQGKKLIGAIVNHVGGLLRSMPKSRALLKDLVAFADFDTRLESVESKLPA